MSRFYRQLIDAEEWGNLLVDPEKQFKTGYSARTLANCWQEANNDFPDCVRKAFNNSDIPLFKDIELLFGLPEYKVSLPGGSRESQNDIYVIAKGANQLVAIMVEGKVSESFDKQVSEWLGNDPSTGKKERLQFLVDKLNLDSQEVGDLRYQLLHRAVSAVLEAEKLGAKHALMLIHSFSQTSEWFQDYSLFVERFGLLAEKDKIVGPVHLNGIELCFGWVSGDKKYLER